MSRFFPYAAKLERLTKHRVLRVEEVGEAFEEALKLVGEIRIPTDG